MDGTRPGVCGLIALAVLLGPGLWGCGEEGGAAKGPAKGEVAKAPVVEQRAPAEQKAPAKALPPGQAWAEKVLACYAGALKDAVAAMDGATAAEALPKLKAMKEKYIEALVPLGREREAMDAPTKAQAEMALSSKLMGLQSSEDFKKYHQLATGPFNGFKAKTAEEKEAAALAASVNILTQYAHFELLKKQAPKEAERLGIK